MSAAPFAKTQQLEDPAVWVDRYGDYLYRFALSRINDTVLAEDLVQETFLAALKSRASFKRQSAAKTWLTAILKHKIVDCIRKRQRERIIDNEEALNRNLEAYFNQDGNWKIHPHKWENNPIQHYEQKEFLDTLFECLAVLPRRIAQIFMLREMEGLQTDEICQAMQITATNCWTMLYRARTGLRNCLELNWFNSNR